MAKWPSLGKWGWISNICLTPRTAEFPPCVPPEGVQQKSLEGSGVSPLPWTMRTATTVEHCARCSALRYLCFTTPRNVKYYLRFSSILLSLLFWNVCSLLAFILSLSHWREWLEEATCVEKEEPPLLWVMMRRNSWKSIRMSRYSAGSPGEGEGSLTPQAGMSRHYSLRFWINTHKDTWVFT